MIIFLFIFFPLVVTFFVPHASAFLEYHRNAGPARNGRKQHSNSDERDTGSH